MYSQVVTTELYPCHTYVMDSCFLVLLEWDLIDMVTQQKDHNATHPGPIYIS